LQSNSFQLFRSLEVMESYICKLLEEFAIRNGLLHISVFHNRYVKVMGVYLLQLFSGYNNFVQILKTSQ